MAIHDSGTLLKDLLKSRDIVLERFTKFQNSFIMSENL